MKSKISKFFTVYIKVLMVTALIFLTTIALQMIPRTNDYLDTFSLLIQKLIFLIIPVLFWVIVDKKNWRIGINQNRKCLSFLKGAGVGTIFITFPIVISLFFVENSITSNGISLSVLLTLSICFVTALSEEVMFRGYIQGLVENSYNAKVGILFSAVFFVAMHGFNTEMNILSYLEILAGGIFLGLIKKKTNGLWTGIGFHFAWNFVQEGIFGFPLTEVAEKSILTLKYIKENFILGSPLGPESSSATIIILIMGIAVLIKRNRNQVINDLNL
ncbi:type II CAAX endopeptidase family protein [Priestia aryabhattai]|uniref:Type II CAAX endopeptidase family protein n=1 Tax=Priestia aryabhattai TaxID=412384 RepID=A0AAX6ND56_PRIAR|nr:type II CAAX endopeptidase family protein [Priestia aryabhattai]MDU9693600.1 type II CAAX endopeptidase family protein [Priestia aryabhattai]